MINIFTYAAVPPATKSTILKRNVKRKDVLYGLDTNLRSSTGVQPPICPTSNKIIKEKKLSGGGDYSLKF